MIRVNLLPIKQARRRSAGKAQLAAFGGVLAFELFVVLSLWFFAQGDLDRAQEQVADYERDVAAAKEEVKDAQQLEAQKDQLQKQLGVLDRLEAQRSGPVRVLDEFQAMMSPPRNEEDRFAQLQKNWNVDWDPRRLWVEKLEESKGGKTGASFKLNGGAVNADDVAEFLQRLSSAEYFEGVQLDVVEADSSTDTVSFKITGKINYAGRSSGFKAEGS